MNKLEGEGNDQEKVQEGPLPPKTAPGVARTVKHEHGIGERILMTDDEEVDTYGERKRKMTEEGRNKRKTAAAAKSSKIGNLGKKTKSEPAEWKLPRRKTETESMDYLTSSKLLLDCRSTFCSVRVAPDPIMPSLEKWREKKKLMLWM